MNFTGAELTTLLASVLWPFIRIGAMFASSPILSARGMPVRIRIVLAMLIAWMLLPMIPAPPAVD